MTTLTARIDRYVCWFFNSSPDGTGIDFRSLVRRRGADVPPHGEIVRRSALVIAVAIALALLGVFYSVVAGAVDRAAVKRVQAASETVALRSPARAPAHPAYLVARKVSFVRASN